MTFDLTNLTITQVITLAVVLAVIDTLAAIVLAITRSQFELGFIGIWITSHVVKRIFPIFVLALLGNGVPAAGLVPIPILFGLAVTALAAYLGETVASVISNFAVNDSPADNDPAA